MLVSHQHRFIYTKTVKTGSSSVESYFEKYCVPPGTWTRERWRDEYETEYGIIGMRGKRRTSERYWHHMSAARIREQIGNHIWSHYLKFCVIRNPFDKLISAFYYFGDQNQNEPFDLRSHREQFRAWLSDRNRTPIDRNKYLIDGEIVMDSWIRFEFLHDDMERICGTMGVPWNLSELPTFKSGVRPDEATVEALYTPETISTVERLFAFELETFGYSYDDACAAANRAEIRAARSIS